MVALVYEDKHEYLEVSLVAFHLTKQCISNPFSSRDWKQVYNIKHVYSYGAGLKSGQKDIGYSHHHHATIVPVGTSFLGCCGCWPQGPHIKKTINDFLVLQPR